MRGAVTLFPFPVAVMVEVVDPDTAVVPIVNVAVDCPPATVIEAGRDATGLLEVRDIVQPALGAATLSVTVPVELPPPATALGESERAVG